jgi:hypothetical protein
MKYVGMIFACILLGCGSVDAPSPPGQDCAHGLGKNVKPVFGVATMVCTKDLDSGLNCCESYADECACYEHWCENFKKGCWVRMDDISTCDPGECPPQNSSITQ